MKPPWRPRRRNAEPESIEGLMSTVIARLGGDERARELRAFDAWERSAGEVLRSRSQPEALRGTTLYVRTSSSAVAHQIAMLKADILALMGHVVGDDLVKDVRTRVGPLRGG